ncbi:GNAT family N-acetyltransferase [Streptomyces sp. AV19]|uniref:GNAT family N-acetyltransferase n=1 Tax=Streptomyces sp. AV19 TaxID=2793068 RepID=UPI0018FE0ED3|nr:GNAT family N-acetyltransferase [Streptomyces sp. AV19]MBH1939165.1 GNAT family N-acetyltransferase [Streptomyces sp. AV19]MDG4536810.1 GNAT family N-acetyltransferase [Streptomyces sp. AV19]
MGTTRVASVRDRAGQSDFLRLPYRLHGGDALWAPPLLRERRRFLDPAVNPFFEFGEAKLFVAYRDGRPVGRIAALVNHRHNELHDPGAGFFGLFDVVDDVTVAQRLLDAAAGWLRDRGKETMLGPANFTFNHESGVLVDGFDRAQSLLTPYNPRYYPALIEAAGLTKAKDFYAWHGPVPTEVPTGVARAAEWAARRPGVRVRKVRMGGFAAELRLFRDIYNAAWSGNWGFSPMTDRQVARLARELRPVVHPELLLVAEVGGEPAGMLLLVPDICVALRAAGGRLTRWGLPVGLVRMRRAARRITHLRTLAGGVRPEHRRLGLDALMYRELMRAAYRLGFQTFEMGPTLEDNQPVIRVASRLATRTKTYRIYHRVI